MGNLALCLINICCWKDEQEDDDTQFVTILA